MVLHLSTSPFAPRVTSTSSSSSLQKNISSSSSPSRLSFLSERAKGYGHGHNHSKRSSSSSSSSSSSFSSKPWLSTFTLPNKKNSLIRSNSSSSTATTASEWSTRKGNYWSIDLWARNVFRLMGIVSGIFTLYIVPRLKDSGLKHGFGRGTQYLTILSLCLTMINMSLGIAGDLLKNHRLLKIKDAMLPVIAPGECVVAVLYWYLTLSDVYNIYPDGNRYIPFWIDFQMHGLPVLFVLAEMFYFSRHFKVRRFADVCFLSFFAVFYMAWSSFCAHMDGEWPYPILENLNCPWKRLRMMISSYLIYIACYLILSETHIRSKASRKFKHIIESAKETL